MVGLDMFPEHVVIVAVDFEEGLHFIDGVAGGEDSLEVTDPAEFLLALEEHHPVLGTEDFEAVAPAQLFQVVDVLRVVPLVLLPVVEQPFLLLLLQPLHLLTAVTLNADQVEQVSEQSVLDLAVHGGAGAEGRTDIDFHEPGLKGGVHEDIETIELKAAVSFFLSF